MAKKIKRYKVGLESETYAISLVEEPAIEETLIALEKQKEMKVQLANEEKHMVYSAVLVPDKPIYRRNDDGDEFYVEFSKESIEHMSHQFMKDYRNVTIDHQTDASDITVVESWVKADLYKDKSVALGLNENLPIGTWFCAMKVNQIDAWDRIKSGELRGFSVESLIRLEEFEKQNNNNMIEIDEMSFWTKLKEVLKETFSNEKKEKDDDTDDDDNNTPIEEQLEAETPVEAPKAEEAPKVETVVEQPKAEETPVEQPKVDSHLEDLINSMKEEIEALKELNSGLNKKIKDLGKQPSAQPVNTNAKPSAADTYSAWREQMAKYLGH